MRSAKSKERKLHIAKKENRVHHQATSKSKLSITRLPNSKRLTCRTALTIGELQPWSSYDQGREKNSPKLPGCHSSRCPLTPSEEKVRGEGERFTL
jgi:hypothetical protein